MDLLCIVRPIAERIVTKKLSCPNFTKDNKRVLGCSSFGWKLSWMDSYRVFQEITGRACYFRGTHTLKLQSFFEIGYLDAKFCCLLWWCE